MLDLLAEGTFSRGIGQGVACGCGAIASPAALGVVPGGRMYRPFMAIVTFPRNPARTGAVLSSTIAALGLLAGCGASVSSYGGTTTLVSDEMALPASPAHLRLAPVAHDEQLSPAAFAARMRTTRGKLINVHVPDMGEIPGTNYHIAYDHIVGDKRLPAAKDTEILIYCRSGNMSAIAAKSLIQAGYTRIVELAGGFAAWQADGRPFTPAHP